MFTNILNNIAHLESKRYFLCTQLGNYLYQNRFNAHDSCCMNYDIQVNHFYKSISEIDQEISSFEFSTYKENRYNLCEASFGPKQLEEIVSISESMLKERHTKTDTKDECNPVAANERRDRQLNIQQLKRDSIQAQKKIRDMNARKCQKALPVLMI